MRFDFITLYFASLTFFTLCRYKNSVENNERYRFLLLVYFLAPVGIKYNSTAVLLVITLF